MRCQVSFSVLSCPVLLACPKLPLRYLVRKSFQYLLRITTRPCNMIFETDTRKSGAQPSLHFRKISQNESLFLIIKMQIERSGQSKN